MPCFQRLAGISLAAGRGGLRQRVAGWPGGLEQVAPGPDVPNTDIFALFLDPKKELYRWVEC